MNYTHFVSVAGLVNKLNVFSLSESHLKLLPKAAIALEYDK